MPLEIRVNGAPVQVDLQLEDEELLLLGVLRDRLGLTGTKYGCGEGECGACKVLVDGLAVPSCITPVGSVRGKEVLTIEGLEQDGKLHPLQQAFLDNGAFQCGYCTPGTIISALALLNTCSNPTREEIVAAMDRNVCRCGTYLRIIRAIQQAATALQAERAEEATV